MQHPPKLKVFQVADDKPYFNLWHTLFHYSFFIFLPVKPLVQSLTSCQEKKGKRRRDDLLAWLRWNTCFTKEYNCIFAAKTPYANCLTWGKMEEGISESLQCRFQQYFCSAHYSLYLFSDGVFSFMLWQIFGNGFEYRCRQVLMRL